MPHAMCPFCSGPSIVVEGEMVIHPFYTESFTAVTITNGRTIVLSDTLRRDYPVFGWADIATVAKPSSSIFDGAVSFMNRLGAQIPSLIPDGAKKFFGVNGTAAK